MADILRIQEEAKDRGFDSAEFFVSAPKCVFKARWLDAYFGFFTMPALGDGFVTPKHLPPGSEAFWGEADAEAHNEEEFAALRDLLASMQNAGDE